MRYLFLTFALALAPALVQGQGMPARDGDDLLARATFAARRLPEAERLGARIERTRDGRSFAMIWRPPAAPAAPAGWIVSLHGSGSWAADEIVLWQPFAQKRQLGIIALQWWFGGGEQMSDYYAPPDMRREIERLLTLVDARPETTLLHGFSRGSANLYALAAMDGRQPRPLFRSVVANAGGMAPNFPMNGEIESGRFGPAPFANTRWWLYCGGRDPNPDRDGCPAMRRSQRWLQDRGAQAELIEDGAGNHGGFHRHGQNVERALDWFLGAR